MPRYKVRNKDGSVIGQYDQPNPPENPDSYDGVWEVEEADELNDEPVDWWNFGR